MRFAALPLSLLPILTVIAGCATVTTGGFQTIGIKTEPEGADCIFSREGNVIARVNPTPGSILIGKNMGNISVLCRKDGFQETAGATDSQFQPMTLGNIILGGIIGVVVDAASGAMMKYPEAVTFVMVPQEFPSVADRDRFFADLGKSFLVGYEETVVRVRKSCPLEDCERQMQAMEAGRAAKLDEIEQRRLLARVGGAN